MSDNGKASHLDLLGAGAHLTVSDAATRAGEMIASQVRSVMDATDAHARTIVAEAQADARRMMGEARLGAAHVRAQVDAIADRLEALLREIQRDIDRFAAILAPDDYFGGPTELTQGDLRGLPESSGPLSQQEAEQPVEPEPASEVDEPTLSEVAGEDSDEPAAADKVEVPGDSSGQQRRFTRDPRPHISVVEAEPAEPPATPAEPDWHDEPCIYCASGGGCVRCRGRGRRFGMRCPDCDGSGVCPQCRGSGHVRSARRVPSAS